jgi:hypothetical protein
MFGTVHSTVVPAQEGFCPRGLRSPEDGNQRLDMLRLVDAGYDRTETLDHPNLDDLILIYHRQGGYGLNFISMISWLSCGAGSHFH